MDSNTKKKWVIKMIQKYGPLKEITCLYLTKDGKCRIYKRRLSCCRNFPKSIGNSDYCTKRRSCLIIKYKISNNTPQSSQACFKCQSVCCKEIQYPERMPLTKYLLKKWMNINCKDCIEVFV